MTTNADPAIQSSYAYSTFGSVLAVPVVWFCVLLATAPHGPYSKAASLTVDIPAIQRC
jgi:hypothetical protein